MPTPGEMLAQSLPEEQAPAPAPQGADELNPILDAFRTIMAFVGARNEQGDPNAGEMQALLSQFMQLVVGEQGPAVDDQSMMAPPGGQVPVGPGGANPMIASSPGAQAQTGRVPVI